MGELVNYGLLLRKGERYEVSHALIRTYARQRLAATGEIAGRLAVYYAGFAHEQSALGLAGYARLDGEREHMIRVLATCAERGEWEAAKALVWTVGGYLDIRGYTTERRQALEIGVAAAQHLGDRWDEEKLLGGLGNAYHVLGQMEKAVEYYRQALTIAREIGYRQDEGNQLGNLGNAYHVLGQVEKAIEYYEQGLTIAREISDRHGEGNRLGSLGIAYSDLGQMEKAIGYYEQALTTAQEIGHRRNEGIWLGNLGEAYRDLGQVEKAIEYHAKALTIDREIGYRQGEGDDLGNLGIAYRDLGQVEQAEQCWRQALAIFEAIKSPYAEQVRELLAGLEGS